MKRRHFSTGLVAGTVLAGSGISSSAVAGGKPVALPHMHKQAFEACLNETFSLSGINNQANCQLKLQAVEGAGQGEQFFVRFTANQRNDSLTEDMYLLKGQSGQELVLHLQPSASEKHSLEAVINLQTA